jgi:hypothetical protein
VNACIRVSYPRTDDFYFQIWITSPNEKFKFKFLQQLKILISSIFNRQKYIELTISYLFLQNFICPWLWYKFWFFESFNFLEVHKNIFKLKYEYNVFLPFCYFFLDAYEFSVVIQKSLKFQVSVINL